MMFMAIHLPPQRRRLLATGVAILLAVGAAMALFV
jgi:hypothetical protein